MFGLAAVRGECGQTVAVFEHPEFAWRQPLPGFVRRQRPGGHHHDAIVRMVVAREVDHFSSVDQTGLTEGIHAPHHVQFGRATRKQALAITQQKIEGSMLCERARQACECRSQHLAARGLVTEAFDQTVEQGAERRLAVGFSTGYEAALGMPRGIAQIAVVGEQPVAPPQGTPEGMAIRSPGSPLGGLADMCDEVG